jgi:hypothetical protein
MFKKSGRMIYEIGAFEFGVRITASFGEQRPAATLEGSNKSGDFHAIAITRRLPLAKRRCGHGPNEGRKVHD